MLNSPLVLGIFIGVLIGFMLGLYIGNKGIRRAIQNMLHRDDEDGEEFEDEDY